MPIKVRCPKCNDAFKTSSKNRGRRVECPLCDTSIRVSTQSRKKGEQKAAAVFDDEIAGVLAADDGLPPREFVPSVLDDDPSGLASNDLEDSNAGLSGLGIDSGVDLNGAERVGGDEEGGPSLDVSYDAVPVYTGEKPGFDFRRAATPFAAGVLVGAVVASAAWGLFGRGGSTAKPASTPAPAPAAPVKIAADIEPAAPPESDDEKAALLQQVSAPTARLEQGGGLLGGGRTLVFRIRNESGLVLRGVTLDATLGLAAFDDAVIAEQQIVVPFTPVLGVGEEQEVRLPAPEGAIANAKLSGPVRLTATVVDLDWLE